MLTMEQIWVEGARMARFGLVGAGSALVYLVVTVASVRIGLAPLTATMVGFAFATCVSYFGHQLFSFAVESNHRAYIRRFMVITVASMVVNLAITWLFTEFLGLSYFLSIAAVTVLVPVANYFGNRFWVFLPGLRSATVSEEVVFTGAAPSGPDGYPVNVQSRSSRAMQESIMAVELTLPFPDAADPARRAVWTGTEFAIGAERERILAYDVGDSGWTDDLTKMHEVVAGSDHFIDVASREHAFEEVRQSVKAAEPTILEIGCSSGFFLRELAAKLPRALVIGADYTLSTLQILAPTIPGIPLVRFDLTRCPLPADFADVAILINVLEHIDDDEAAVTHLYRIMRPGSRVVIEVPAGPGLMDIYDKALLHHRRYDMARLVALLTRAGFKIETCSHLGFLLYPAFYLSKRLNQIRYGNSTDVDQEKIVASMISSTGKASGLMSYVMAAENFLRRYVYLPVGIRCLVTCSKPG